MMADDSLTARNRINQRNFRARRQNYIKELEERIRKYESDGVQATIEIQSAARQVTDQNIKLRSLLIQRFGMSDFDISAYLGSQPPSPLSQNQPYQSYFAPNAQLANLAPAPSGVSTTHSQTPSDLTQSYPTPPQQAELPRSMTSAHLDPALSLASLHRYPSSTSNQEHNLSEISSRQNSTNSTHQAVESKSSPFEIRRVDSPTDTLSESSNPATPAEPMHMSSSKPTLSHPAPPLSKPDSKSNQCAQKAPKNDETACEEAARIIASMRGGDGNADEVMLELGCASPSEKCRVRNMSIFQLMDRG